jgi:hypothetical protein
MLTMVRPERLGRDVMYMSSHAGNDAAWATWLQRDVYAESCWQRRCWGDLAVVRCRCEVMLATVLLSHVGVGAVEATWLRHCHTPVLGNRTEAFIRVSRMFKSHIRPIIW